MERTIDARGMACPLPVVNAKKACEEMQAGDVLTVLVDNEIAVQNLLRFSSYRNHTPSAEKRGENEYAVVIRLGEGAAAEPAAADAEEELPACTPSLCKKGLLVALSSSAMGSGDPKLGASLMKAFVFALTRQDQLPETILCYNSGAQLSCEGADTLQDLKALEAEGVTVLTCGTCLDYYGLKDKLAVGGVTNMYDIVERMESARTIIKP